MVSLSRHWAAKLCCAAMACLLPVAASFAGAIDQLREFTASTQSASGAFTQRTLKDSGQVAESTSGRFSFARPGRFRWEVAKPYEQLVLADGDQVWFYDKDLNQVVVRKLGEAMGATPAAILFGSANLDKSFELSELPAREGLAWVGAKPRTKDSGFEQIAIGLRDGLPVAMEVRDAFGRLSVFAFSTIVRNGPVDAAAYRFTPPKGAEVIRQ